MNNEEVRRQFEAWLADEIAQNGGIKFGADYRHWALKGYQAALSSPAVVALVEAADDMLCPSYRGPDQDRLRTALAPFTTGAGHVE